MKPDKNGERWFPTHINFQPPYPLNSAAAPSASCFFMEPGPWGPWGPWSYGDMGPSKIRKTIKVPLEGGIYLVSKTYFLEYLLLIS